MVTPSRAVCYEQKEVSSMSESRELVKYTSMMVTVLLVFGMWHFMVARESGRYIERFAYRSIESLSTALPVKNLSSINESQAVKRSSQPSDFYSLDSRDLVVRAAFGRTLSTMNIPQKIEFSLSWLIVFLLTCGLAYLLCKRRLPGVHAVMAVVMYGMIAGVVIIPYASHYYGAVRTYFTGMVVLAPVICIGMRDFGEKIKVRGDIILAVVLVFYALCTSGIMHSFWGIVK